MFACDRTAKSAKEKQKQLYIVSTFTHRAFFMPGYIGSARAFKVSHSLLLCEDLRSCLATIPIAYMDLPSIIDRAYWNHVSGIDRHEKMLPFVGFKSDLCRDSKGNQACPQIFNNCTGYQEKKLRLLNPNHETQGPPDQITVTASIARELRPVSIHIGR
jgi:hypothetical protein